MKTRTLTTCALLTALALVLGYVESLFPLPVPIPGVKLGLSNIVLLLALEWFSPWTALLLMALKTTLGGLLYSGVTAMLYGLAGGAFAVAAMTLCKKAACGMPLRGVAGAIAHNAAQLMLAVWVTRTAALFSYAPVLMLSAVLTGMLTGKTAQIVVRALRKP